MKPERSRFEELTREEQGWIEGYVNGTLSDPDFRTMEDRIASDTGFRTIFRRYLAMDSHLIANPGSGGTERSGTSVWLEETPVVAAPSRPSIFKPLAVAAALAFFSGLAFMHWLVPGDPATAGIAGEQTEASAEGFAVIGNLSTPVWKAGASPKRAGDTLSRESFELASGTAEIQFFSGATMIVAGPAEISLTSAWEATCHEGRVRMRVPPAARGFKLHAPSTEIIDLGTEFGLEVSGEKAHVEVFEGEIEFKHRDGEKRLVESGSAWTLPRSESESPSQTGQANIPNQSDFETQASRLNRADFDRWTRHRDRLAQDPRLIAYYTFDQKGGHVPDLASSSTENHDGAIVLAEPVDGRWPGFKSALEFRRPGARVRVNIPGEFEAFTFSAWVRIDSLDRQYSALFLGDGYETGEPHWQINEDGQMMLSVMVDDSRPNPRAKNGKGFHRVYFSPPMWNRSMSGQWIHLASIFDPANARVSHFVNGEKIDSQTIEKDYLIKQLRIGNGEVGNWGLPFSEDPTWAIRNLNGRIDEFAIFKQALSDTEIAELFQNSRVGR